MYSPKRQLRLFRDPAWPSKDDHSLFTYSWTQPSTGPSIIATTIGIDDTGLNAIIATSTPTDGAEGPYVTRDGGRTWTRSVTGISFPALASTVTCAIARSSPNIMYCANAGGSGGRYIYKSTDYGSTWSEITTPGSTNWHSIICNSTGTIVLATETNGIHRSTNGGSTWTNIAPFGNTAWGPCCMSENGLIIVVGLANGGNMYRTTNGGTTAMTSTGVAGAWRGISCSSDGSVIFAASSTSTMMCALSTNSGANWTTAVHPSGDAVNKTGYRRTACSVNGNKLVVTDGVSSVAPGYIWVSQDRGTTWTQQADLNSSVWQGLAMTLNGKTILAGTVVASKPWVGIGV